MTRIDSLGRRYSNPLVCMCGQRGCKRCMSRLYQRRKRQERVRTANISDEELDRRALEMLRAEGLRR